MTRKAKPTPAARLPAKGQALLEAKLPGPGIVAADRGRPRRKRRCKRTALQWDADLPGVYRVEALQHPPAPGGLGFTPTPFGLNK